MINRHLVVGIVRLFRIGCRHKGGVFQKIGKKFCLVCYKCYRYTPLFPPEEGWKKLPLEDNARY